MGGAEQTFSWCHAGLLLYMNHIN